MTPDINTIYHDSSKIAAIAKDIMNDLLPEIISGVIKSLGGPLTGTVSNQAMLQGISACLMYGVSFQMAIVIVSPTYNQSMPGFRKDVFLEKVAAVHIDLHNRLFHTLEAFVKEKCPDAITKEIIKNANPN